MSITTRQLAASVKLPDIKPTATGLVPTPAELLRLLRKRKGWSRDECARLLNVTPRALAGWEDGSRRPKPIVQDAIRAFVTKHA